MLHQYIAVDLAKRDAVRIFVERLLEWIVRSRLVDFTELSDAERSYRKGWNDALASVTRRLSE